MIKSSHNIGIFLLSLFIVLPMLVSCEDDMGTDPNESEDPRLALVGTWNVEEESSTFGEQSYSAEIKIDPDNESNVKIFNFFKLGSNFSVTALHNGNKIVINKQTVDDIIIEGQGIIANNYTSIIWEFYADLGTGSEFVTATFTTFAISNDGEEFLTLK